MSKIFYLMGKSSSGKDTIYKRLMSEDSLDLKQIVQYTTRPIRQGEKEGIEYFFVSMEAMKELEQTGKVIESRAYDTCHGIWIYATVADESINLKENDYLMIGTLESFVKVQEYFGRDIVVPIMIQCDDGVRLQRALDRERSQDEPKYEEMCRRFLADSVDFSADKKEAAGIQREFINDDLEKCLEEIIFYIKKLL